MTRSRTGRNRDQYPLFQLWRPNGTRQYERVYASSSDSGTFTMSDVSGITTGEYLPNDPVTFHSGYILGVYQPGDVKDRRLSLWFVSNYGHRNYFRDGGTLLEVFNTDESVTGSDYPLVAVNTSENQHIKSGAYELLALCCS